MARPVAYAPLLLLLASALLPATLGHDDTGGRPGDVDDGVSGTFVGPAGHFVAVTGTPLPPPVGPDFLSSTFSMVCDYEILGDGNTPSPLDETRVDQGADPGANGGSRPDGTFNDGGNGGACHTNHNGHAPYNTPGCLDDGARAADTASPAAPWLATSCDWKTGSGSGPSLLGPLVCFVDGVLGGLDGQPGPLLDCVRQALEYLTCELDPLCHYDVFEACGSDGTADGFNFGPGDARVPYPSIVGAPSTFTGDGLGCDDGDATMSVFVLEGVVVDGGLAHVNPATTGEVWQVA